jgi:predicted Zn finger-like uncharacterized protein
MKVVCPHCSAGYSIDDRRVPASGLNVRCPKCRNAFPVRKPPDTAVPLPAPADASAIAASLAPSAPVPLPSPDPIVAAPPPAIAPPPEPFQPAPDAAVPLPAPPVPDPFAAFEVPAGGSLPPEPPADPLPFAEDEIPAPAFEADPFPVEDAPPPEAAPEQIPDFPLPELNTPEPLRVDPDGPLPVAAEPSDPLEFGEVEFTTPAAPSARFVPPAPPEDRTPPSAPPSAGSDSAGEELEMLFGEGAGAAKRPVTAGAPLAYKVRRRSGKIFGPFDETQIVEMLGKGELMGNEDVSSDDGGAWSAIGAVPAFGEALRKGAREPAPAATTPDARRGVPFGDRMARAKLVEGGVVSSRRKLVIGAVAVLLVLALGVGAGFTRSGLFFLKAFRRGNAAGAAAILAQARTMLDRAEYPADRAALDLAVRAVADDPDSGDAAALHAMIVAALELRHGAPAGSLDQARRTADRLDAAETGKLPALAARLAVMLAASPRGDTLPQETALEQATAKSPPDADVVALLATAALARGDAPRAAAQVARLESLRPGTPRAGYAAGLALLAKRDLAGAKAAFDKVVAAVPSHLPSRLELAAIAEAAGDAAETEAQLAPLLAAGAEAKLAPAERGRALALRGGLLARSTSSASAADHALEAAVQADDRLVEPRIALARHRLRRGDAAGAVTALEPVAAQAPAVPALAAARIRALAAAGRALDASSLADQALARAPGDPGLLLAKATALEASGKGDDAAALYRDAAARDPAAFEPRFALGRLALARRDLVQARLELAAAVEKGPREPAAHASLGELAVAEGDAAAAEQGFQAALAIDPEYASAEIGLAKLALARGDAPAARARLERALVADPRNAEGQVAYGALLWKAKDLVGAEKAFQAAVDLQPRSAGALTRLGAVKLERGEDLEGAVQRLTAASNEDPRIAETRQWLGRALLRKGETPGAIAQLRKAVELEPSNPEHRIHLGNAFERSGAVPEAVDEYRAAAAADPKFTEAHERLGMVFVANGRFDEAATAYEKAIAAAPKLSRLRISLGDCRARLGKHADALRVYRDVLKSDPAAVQVVYKIARALHEAEGAKAALPWYERAARDDAGNAMPHYYLGYLYKERGHKAKAAAEFKRFLALKPDAEERKDIEAEIEDLAGAAK